MDADKKCTPADTQPEEISRESRTGEIKKGEIFTADSQRH